MRHFVAVGDKQFVVAQVNGDLVDGWLVGFDDSELG